MVSIGPWLEIIEKVYVIQYVPDIILFNYWKRNKACKKAHIPIAVLAKAYEKYQVQVLDCTCTLLPKHQREDA